MLRKVVNSFGHARHLVVEVGFLCLETALIATKPILNKMLKARELVVCDIANGTSNSSMDIIIRA